jgi:hypothetical protein
LLPVVAVVLETLPVVEVRVVYFRGLQVLHPELLTL